MCQGVWDPMRPIKWLDLSDPRLKSSLQPPEEAERSQRHHHELPCELMLSVWAV